ncbi:hypothetical protein BDL97_11G090100 [Sphagnum fallax]|nr:hypothetical protein BDL97_11G090100 [Sphagnum fallax]
MPPLKTDAVVMEHNNFNGTVCGLEIAKDMGVKGLEQKLPKKEHVDMNKRLARVVVEQDNARPQVAKLQVLLSIWQLPQNPDVHFKTLHSKNRCLRHANKMLTDHIEKHQLELDATQKVAADTKQVFEVKVMFGC